MNKETVGSTRQKIRKRTCLRSGIAWGDEAVCILNYNNLGKSLSWQRYCSCWEVVLISPVLVMVRAGQSITTSN